MEVGAVNEIICSGGLFLAKDTKRFLFLLRPKGKTSECWGFTGGKKEGVDVTPYDTLMREISEEVGKTPPIKKVIPLELFVSRDQLFKYNTYALLVEKEFIPVLNNEHAGYAWCDYNVWPRPLHRGVRSCLNNQIIKSKLETILEMI